MSFKDIFKKSFLEGFSSVEITPLTVIVALAIACAISAYIFLVYRVITRKTFYSKNFNISLAAITITTTALILTMQSSVVLSLGMVGALSIVRFRTAIKDPMDLIFLFWGISVGIICGAGLAFVAILLSLVLTVVIVGLSHLPVAKAPMILIVNATSSFDESSLLSLVEGFTKYYKVKSRNLTKDGLDMIIELRLSDDKGVAEKVMSLDGVLSAALLSHDGESTY